MEQGALAWSLYSAVGWPSRHRKAQLGWVASDGSLPWPGAQRGWNTSAAWQSQGNWISSTVAGFPQRESGRSCMTFSDPALNVTQHPCHHFTLVGVSE